MPADDAYVPCAETSMWSYEERCPRCKGKGTIVKDGPSEWEYDSHYPCPTCTTDRTADKGTGWVPVAHESAGERA